MDKEIKKGLTPEDHKLANNPSWSSFWKECGVDKEDFVKTLREKYAGDDIARQQIDVYSENPEYVRHIRDLVLSLKSGDQNEQEIAKLWLATNYPDIGI